MGYFKIINHIDENGDEWLIYHPTVMKKGERVIYVKGKEELPPYKIPKQHHKQFNELLGRMVR